MRLFLCEKPSQGRDIANVLGCHEKIDGALRGNGDVVTWAFGHLLSQADPEYYDASLSGAWSYEQLPIVPSQWQMVVPSDKKKQFNVIKKLLGSCSEMVIATDADREGEVIAREILDYVGYTGRVSRLWLSALDEASIRKGLENLRPGSEHEPLYWAGLGRSQADWLLGMNLTRLCSIAGREVGYRGALSVGRVQTPTLRLVVERDVTIANFVSKPFYDVVAKAGFDAKWQVPEALGDEAGRCLSRDAASQVAAQCQGQPAVVSAFDTKRQKAKHPALFFLGTLQKTMSAQYGYTAQQVLDTAQALYEKHKLTTYPRTDCAFLPTSQQGEVSQVVNALSSESAFASMCHGADAALQSACWNDKKVAQSSHHAIVPTAKTPKLAELSERERHVYIAVVQRYLAQFYPHAEDDATSIELQCGVHRFKASGKVERVKGWRVVTCGDEEKGKDEGKGKREASANQTLPSLTIGQSVTLSDVNVVDKKTTPPAAFTEGTLLDAMANIARSDNIPAQFKAILKETAGLGTQATRAAIIETLKKRGFIEAKGKKLLSTAAGRGVIQALPNEVSNPVMTAIWEQALEGIANKTTTLEAFMQNQEGFVRAIISKVKSGELQINLPKVVEPTAPCPLCGKTMRLRNGKKPFWACEERDQCGLILDSVRGKPAKNQKCACGKGVLVRKSGKSKGSFYWSCSAWKQGCQKRHFDDKGKLGKEIGG
ncbi:DNA topoisomerase III (plasmid) [Vibrio campbellii]|uniref:DNA topoisomerase III n=1 Tax=Vibrio campbellii TaxID=680 RepID=UPI000A2FE596|nr:DNA topoisomerase III [Vibrio campbellii]ARR47862.1 DNA topoisomerase III [Vibrio campbellii]